MGWQSLITALVELFRPAVERWLLELLERVRRRLTGLLPTDPTSAVCEVFAEARAEVLETHWLPWVARRKLAALDRAERVARARAVALCVAAQTGTAPPALDGLDYFDLAPGAL